MLRLDNAQNGYENNLTIGNEETKGSGILPTLNLGKNILNSNSSKNLIVSYQVNTVRVDSGYHPNKRYAPDHHSVSGSSYVLPSINRNINHTSLDNDIRKMRPPGFNELASVQTQSKVTLGEHSLSDGTGVGNFTYNPY